MTAGEFNATHPVGTRVLAFPGTREGRAILTRTRTPAWNIGDHPVVSVDNYPGGIALTHVEIFEETREQPEHGRPAQRRDRSAPAPHPEAHGRHGRGTALAQTSPVPARPAHRSPLLRMEGPQTMTRQQIDRRKIRRQAEEALRRERLSRVGPLVLNAALPTLPPEDVLALLDALDAAEGARDSVMVTAERVTSYARKAEARLQAVQALVDQADVSGEWNITASEVQWALEGDT